ncbi:unnamed protein product, partial [marine sediment metagenome]
LLEVNTFGNLIDSGFIASINNNPNMTQIIIRNRGIMKVAKFR